MTDERFEGFLARRHEGPLIGRREASIRVVVPTGRSAASTAMELEVAAGFQSSLHVHEAVEEILYVLQGRFEFRCGDGTVVLEEGGCAVFPAGIPHRFGNPGPSDGRLLIISAPPGLDRYFAELAEVEAGDGTEREAVQRRHGVRILRAPGED
ncbi:MAG TPA: cupin domain-containing protein [Candidatus Dormibacteraeota bacterium]|jgi:mannose-6-phosphate isomerase-like protein (cupin superfamily)